MPRKKPATPEPEKVTVAELLLALASYPLDAEVTTYENGGGGGALQVTLVDGEEWAELWEGHRYERPKHYERPDVIVQEVQRSDAGEEFAIANEFLAYLRSQSISLVHDGQGHNETASPILPTTRARLAEEFATRETAP